MKRFRKEQKKAFKAICKRYNVPERKVRKAWRIIYGNAILNVENLLKGVLYIVEARRDKNI